MKTWIFFEEGKRGTPEFEIKAPDFSKAYDEAYERYGPQVDDLLYTEKRLQKPLFHLNLKSKWYQMIKAGEKKEEYREIKPYWDRVFGHANILINGRYYHPTDVIIWFANGYRKDRPEMLFECTGLKVSEGRPEWGAEPGQQYYVLSLGDEIILPEVLEYEEGELPF